MILILTDITEFTIHARYVSGLLVLIENIPFYPNLIILAGLTKFTIIKSTGFFSWKKKKKLIYKYSTIMQNNFWGNSDIWDWQQYSRS